jgi:hypothetical protein
VPCPAKRSSGGAARNPGDETRPYGAFAYSASISAAYFSAIGPALELHRRRQLVAGWNASHMVRASSARGRSRSPGLVVTAPSIDV